MTTSIYINKTTFHLPYADLFPALDDDVYASLKADIAERGIVVPIVIDEHNNVLDGQHRLKIAAELGMTEVPFEIRPGLTDHEKQAIAIVLNALRRQLAPEQRRNYVSLLRSMGKSYREIGETLGIDAMTAYHDMQKATVEFSTVAVPTVIIGRDGKHRPATLPRIRADTIKDVAQAQSLIAYVPRDRPETQDLNDLKRARTEHARTAVREQNARLVQHCPPLQAAPEVRYQTIVADPPWDIGDDDAYGRGGPTYALMTVGEIAALPVGDLAAAHSYLYLWVTNRSLRDGFDVLAAWGFRSCGCLTWVKDTFGMGYYFRGQTEHVLFGVRGSLDLLRQDVPTCFFAPRTSKASEKPEVFYQVVETTSPGPWLELFARQPRNGWVSWGAEVASS
jgi:N6-adenosine-specific RNA methylase IME4